MSRPITVLSNRSWVGGRRVGGSEVTAVSIDGGTPLGRIARVFALWRYDAVLIDCAVGHLLLACVARRLLFASRCRIVAVDIVLTRPRTTADRLKFAVRRWLLGAVDVWVLYFRDTSALQQAYGIPDERIRFVPFKPNTRDLLLETPTSDEGYFIACGRSNRDYTALLTAFSGLSQRCVILAPWGDMGDEVTSIEGMERPANVTLERDDGTAVSWNRWIAGSTGVILPITPGMLSPSGIGTYLVAMALGKPVVITDSPATRGLVDGGEAVIVPPSDPGAIAAAVRRLATDPEYRAQVADRGRKYALGLGGEERLREDVIDELARVLMRG